MNDIVIATGASGGPVNTNFAGMDNAYSTPNGKSGSPLFSTKNTAVYPEPTPTFTGDVTGSWDARLDSLNSYLVDSDLIFFFNNNQTGVSQPLFSAAQATVTDLEDLTRTRHFDLINDTNASQDASLYNSPGVWTGDCPYGTCATGTPGVNDFIFTAGQIAIDPVTNLPRYDSNGVPLLPETGDIVINQNLGADQAAFAIFSPELNDVVKNFTTNGYDVLQLDIRMYDLNSGFEQIFIQRGTVGSNAVPEPATLFLFSSALVGAFVKKKFIG